MELTKASHTSLRLVAAYIAVAALAPVRHTAFQGTNDPQGTEAQGEETP